MSEKPGFTVTSDEYTANAAAIMERTTREGPATIVNKDGRAWGIVSVPGAPCFVCSGEDCSCVTWDGKDPAEFWSTLRTLPNGPSLIAALLRAAPKTLCPWKREEPTFGTPGEEWTRRQPMYNGCRILQATVKATKTGRWTWYAGIGRGEVSTIDEAQRAADERLTQDGWLLVNGGGG